LDRGHSAARCHPAQRWSVAAAPGSPNATARRKSSCGLYAAAGHPMEPRIKFSLLEKLYDAQATRRIEAKALVAWTRVALTLIGRERIVEMAARSEDLSAISKFANRLETLLQRTDANFSELVGDKRTGDLLEQIPLGLNRRDSQALVNEPLSPP
jgi:hypothetical protein